MMTECAGCKTSFALAPNGAGSCPECGQLVRPAVPPAPPDVRSFGESTTPEGTLFRSRQSLIGSIVLGVIAVPLALGSFFFVAEVGWPGLAMTGGAVFLGVFAWGAAATGGDVLVGRDSVTVRSTPGGSPERIPIANITAVGWEKSPGIRGGYAYTVSLALRDGRAVALPIGWLDEAGIAYAAARIRAVIAETGRAGAMLNAGDAYRG
jgi:hypothetical protein